MKQIFVFLLMTAIIFSACKNRNTITHTEKNADGTTTTASVDMANLTSKTDEMNKKIEALKKLQPLTLDQLKGLLPEELNGIKRTSFSANTTMGFAVGEAEYGKDDSTQIKLTVYDCAGEAGAGIYSINYWTKMNVQSESSDGYTKTIDFNGDKAVETYEKNNNETTLTYVAKDRLMITLTGRNVSADALKQAAQSLSLKV